MVTDDDDLHAQLVMARSHGWDRNLALDKQQQLRADHAIDDFYAKYTFYDLASNFRPTEINGFIGNLQLPYWDEDSRREREQNYRPRRQHDGRHSVDPPARAGAHGDDLQLRHSCHLPDQRTAMEQYLRRVSRKPTLRFGR